MRSLLYLRLAFPDLRHEPQTEVAAYEMMRQVNDWFVDCSYGRLSMLTTVAPLLVLPRPEGWYRSIGDVNGLRSDAIATAKAMGYDPDAYDHIIFAYQGGSGNFIGLGTVAGKYVWLKGINAGNAAHELGHNFGLWHANFWDTGGRSVIGAGNNREYANGYDTMGGSNPLRGHFNVVWKNRIGWLPDESIHEVRQSGTYRLATFDQPRLDPAGRYALKIRKDDGRSYWAEFRQHFDSANPWLRDGILLNWSPWIQSGGGTQLLDTTPGSPGGKTDAALTIGRTLSDPAAGVHITPVARVGSEAGSPSSADVDAIDVVVNLGTFPDNRPPSAELSADLLAVAPGSTIALIADASDPDGDTLAYHWDFGDGSFDASNQAEVSKSWPNAGEFVVRCLVSDMKGGTASDSLLVRVGSPNSFTISGSISSAGQALANAHVHNGQSGANYRGAHSDSDGPYMISGIDAGTVTLTATHPNYDLSPTFANPLAIASDVSDANFAAGGSVQVSISTIDPNATEGGDHATIRLSRTGSTAAPLHIIQSGFSGSAGEFEYLLSPSADFDFGLFEFVFTIPAGQSNLDLRFTPMDDGEEEEPETLTLEIGSTNQYDLSSGNSATVNFFDGAAGRPLVSVEATDADADESGDAASFLLSRIGPTTNPLDVEFSLSGEATPGIDYAPLGNRAHHPCRRDLRPIDDRADR